MSTNKTWQEAFFSKVERTASCWFWKACKTHDGYGRFKRDSKQYMAHRFIYEKLIEKIKKDLVLDHMCRNRSCVNPKHLRQVTIYVNLTQNSLSPSAINFAKTHCKRGHKFTKENTLKQRRGKNRYCRTCMRAYKKKWNLENTRKKQ